VLYVDHTIYRRKEAVMDVFSRPYTKHVQEKPEIGEDHSENKDSEMTKW
jgi:hypothetical protein